MSFAMPTLADAQGRLRVAIIDHTAVLSGAEIALVRLIEALDRDLVDPIVVLFEDGPLREQLRAHAVEVVVVPLATATRGASRDSLLGGPVTAVRRALSAATFLVRLRHALRYLNVDVVHTMSLKADVLGGLAARTLRRPLVWHVHDRIAGDYLPAWVAAGFRRAARQLPQHVIANSQATLRTLVPLAEGSYTVIYPGLPDEAFDVGPRVAKGAPVVGMIGRISPTKGQEVFIRAAEVVARDHPEALFRIVGTALFGEDEYEHYVRGLPSGLGIEGAVEFAGFVDDPRAELSSFGVLVHASPIPEPFGQVVVEAMAASVPVVATDAGGVSEVVRDGPELLGTLAPPDDYHALAAAISGVLSEPAAAAERARRALHSARRRFRAADTARMVTSVWQRVSGRLSAP
jgi:glycosyltransferase involved in cell wall biosynthesis